MTAATAPAAVPVDHSIGCRRVAELAKNDCAIVFSGDQQIRKTLVGQRTKGNRKRSYFVLGVDVRGIHSFGERMNVDGISSQSDPIVERLGNFAHPHRL